MPWLKECSTRTMIPTEAAWLAGFFDGEGCLGSYSVGPMRQWIGWHLTVPNTHLESLERCHALTLAGNVTLKHLATAERKQQWHWRVSAKRDIHSVITQIRPFLTVKADVADDCINRILL